MPKAIAARINPEMNIIFVRSWKEIYHLTVSGRITKVPSSVQTSTYDCHRQKEVFFCCFQSYDDYGKSFHRRTEGHALLCWDSCNKVMISCWLSQKNLANPNYYWKLKQLKLIWTNSPVLKTLGLHHAEHFFEWHNSWLRILWAALLRPWTKSPSTS